MVFNRFLNLFRDKDNNYCRWTFTVFDIYNRWRYPYFLYVSGDKVKLDDYDLGPIQHCLILKPEYELVLIRFGGFFDLDRIHVYDEFGICGVRFRDSSHAITVKLAWS